MKGRVYGHRRAMRGYFLASSSLRIEMLIAVVIKDILEELGFRGRRAHR